MRTITNLSEFPELKKKTAVAIGNFDGVHLGHQRILTNLIKTARNNDLVPVVLTFSPHPEKFFNKDDFHLIQTPEEKLDFIRQFRIKITVELSFDKALSQLSPSRFMEDILIRSLLCKYIVVGRNFRFGKNRKGDVKHLQKMARVHHIKLQSIPQVSLQGETISSSKIRSHLYSGEIERANQFLGRPYQINGTVIKGYSRGKHIGFPTANLESHHDIIPKGVFITESLIRDKSYPSVTNIGKCPTFKNSKDHIESHILNLQDEIYGTAMTLRFFKKIRDEKKFDSPEMLKKQIARDINSAKQYFSRDTS
ncbi:MAG: bifunctional riboflavin kinase/FAD synthetase [Candidatus Aminicenantes bacterium]|nr:bifunctional riboflavin kinase/FAD synthetase [Candidatus Aminicenantes bacterium]